MHKILKFNKCRVIFSKWSRKSYAIFSSLNKVVNIAGLRVDICLVLLLDRVLCNFAFIRVNKEHVLIESAAHFNLSVHAFLVLSCLFIPYNTEFPLGEIKV